MVSRKIQNLALSSLIGIVATTFTLGLIPATVAPGEQPVGLLADYGNYTSMAASVESQPESLHHLSEDGLAALTVYMEAKGESFAGKLAVAAVIRNRMNLKYHSDGTVKGTVLKRWQFEPWNTRKPHQVPFNLEEKRMRDSLMAWRLVQDGRDVVEGAVLFYNPRIARTPRWAKIGQKVATIGRHEFYKPRRQET